MAPESEQQTEHSLEAMKQRYLLKTTIQQALRSLYGDRATPLFATFANDMANELQARGVQLRK